MGRRREEKVDEEELARLESPEGEASVGRIRVKMPNSKVNEMFALAEQILGGRRVNVLWAMLQKRETFDPKRKVA